MGAENILGVKPPGVYYSPDGKKVGIAVSVTAAAGIVIGGTIWFAHSPQAVHLRERAANLLGRGGTENPRWLAYLPDMLDNGDDPEVTRKKLEDAVYYKSPVFHTPAGEVAEYSVRSLELFALRDFQISLEQQVYILPLLRLSTNKLPRTSLPGINFPEGAHIPVKGVIEVLHGSGWYRPSSGVQGIIYGIVGGDDQTLAQLRVDRHQAEDKHLITLQDKITFVQIGKSQYRIEKNPNRNVKPDKRFFLRCVKQEWLGKWINDEELE